MRRNVVWVWLVVVLLGGSLSVSSRTAAAVHGGEQVTLIDFGPWQSTVSLWWQSGLLSDASCTGSLVAERVVITAAHCLTGVKGIPDSVRFGALDHGNSPVPYWLGAPPGVSEVAVVRAQRWSQTGTTYAISGVNSVNADIALLELAQPVTAVAPARFLEGPTLLTSDSNVPATTPGVTHPSGLHRVVPGETGLDSAGYGLEHPDESAPHSVDLHRTGDMVRDPGRCGGPFARRLCVEPSDGMSTLPSLCFGDSGGPTLVESDGALLIAVTESGDMGCFSPGAVGSLGFIRPWVEDFVPGSSSTMTPVRFDMPVDVTIDVAPGFTRLDLAGVSVNVTMRLRDESWNDAVAAQRTVFFPPLGSLGGPWQGNQVLVPSGYEVRFELVDPQGWEIVVAKPTECALFTPTGLTYGQGGSPVSVAEALAEKNLYRTSGPNVVETQVHHWTDRMECRLLIRPQMDLTPPEVPDGIDFYEYWDPAVPGDTPDIDDYAELWTPQVDEFGFAVADPPQVGGMYQDIGGNWYPNPHSSVLYYAGWDDSLRRPVLEWDPHVMTPEGRGGWVVVWTTDQDRWPPKEWKVPGVSSTPDWTPYNAPSGTTTILTTPPQVGTTPPTTSISPAQPGIDPTGVLSAIDAANSVGSLRAVWSGTDHALGLRGFVGANMTGTTAPPWFGPGRRYGVDTLNPITLPSTTPGLGLDALDPGAGLGGGGGIDGVDIFDFDIVDPDPRTLDPAGHFDGGGPQLPAPADDLGPPADLIASLDGGLEFAALDAGGGIEGPAPDWLEWSELHWEPEVYEYGDFDAELDGPDPDLGGMAAEEISSWGPDEWCSQAGVCPDEILIDAIADARASLTGLRGRLDDAVPGPSMLIADLITPMRELTDEISVGLDEHTHALISPEPVPELFERIEGRLSEAENYAADLGVALGQLDDDADCASATRDEIEAALLQDVGYGVTVLDLVDGDLIDELCEVHSAYHAVATTEALDLAVMLASQIHLAGLDLSSVVSLVAAATSFDVDTTFGVPEVWPIAVATEEVAAYQAALLYSELFLLGSDPGVERVEQFVFGAFSAVDAATIEKNLLTALHDLVHDVSGWAGVDTIPPAEVFEMADNSVGFTTPLPLDVCRIDEEVAALHAVGEPGLDAYLPAHLATVLIHGAGEQVVIDHGQGTVDEVITEGLHHHLALTVDEAMSLAVGDLARTCFFPDAFDGFGGASFAAALSPSSPARGVLSYLAVARTGAGDSFVADTLHGWIKSTFDLGLTDLEAFPTLDHVVRTRLNEASAHTPVWQEGWIHDSIGPADGYSLIDMTIQEHAPMYEIAVGALPDAIDVIRHPVQRQQLIDAAAAARESDPSMTLPDLLKDAEANWFDSMAFPTSPLPGVDLALPEGFDLDGSPLQRALAWVVYEAVGLGTVELAVCSGGAQHFAPLVGISDTVILHSLLPLSALSDSIQWDFPGLTAAGASIEATAGGWSYVAPAGAGVDSFEIRATSPWGEAVALVEIDIEACGFGTPDDLNQTVCSGKVQWIVESDGPEFAVSLDTAIKGETADGITWKLPTASRAGGKIEWIARHSAWRYSPPTSSWVGSDSIAYEVFSRTGEARGTIKLDVRRC